MATPTPYLSVFDPEVSSEGGIDPLSLQATYERLAERIYPFMTVRMKRIRFLTAIAIGAEVCRDLRDELSENGRTPAWLVFEWYVVEGLLRSGIKGGGGDLWGDGVPGAAKVGRVVRADQRLGASSYLKTPKIFGFTGVYRRLATGLNVVDSELLLDNSGIELLEAWERDQAMKGFVTGTGPGADFKAEMREAVRKAVREGYTCRTSSWEGWSIIGKHLHPDRAAVRERELLLGLLTNPDLRRHPSEPDSALVSKELITALEKGDRVVDKTGEKDFFARSRKTGSPELRERLESIDAYERLCRILEDAFALVRHVSTLADCDFVSVANCNSFDKGLPASRLYRSLGPALEGIAKAFGGTKRDEWVSPLLQRYGEVSDVSTFLSTVLAHHEEAQRNKPPDGKRSWLETNGRDVAVRSLYAVQRKPIFDQTYVHDYRTRTASDFLLDLRRLPR